MSRIKLCEFCQEREATRAYKNQICCEDCETEQIGNEPVCKAVFNERIRELEKEIEELKDRIRS